MPLDPQSFRMLDWRALTIETTGRSSGACDCCASTTERVWGCVDDAVGHLAVYYVGWTSGKPDHGAAFDLIVGPWGDGTSPADRAALALDYRMVDAGPAFMIKDAGAREVCTSSAAAQAFARADVIGTPLADHVFAVVDAILMIDPRLDAVRSWRTMR